jgi:acetyl esterase/lipase
MQPAVSRCKVVRSSVNPDDPILSPVDLPRVLAMFPPTLFITASRDLAMSSAIYTNEGLSELGVPTELHVWDGLFHGFFYDPDVPESRACYRVMVRFFEHRLAGD